MKTVKSKRRKEFMSTRRRREEDRASRPAESSWKALRCRASRGKTLDLYGARLQEPALIEVRGPRESR